MLALGLSIVIATPAPAQPLTGVLKRIKDSGEITLGHRDASVPFSYLDDKQQPVGYSMDLCLRVVDAVKAELKLPALKVIYNPVTSANRIPLIANGTIELECGSTVNNVERQAQVAFSDTTFIVSTQLHRQTRRQSQDAGRPARQDGAEAYSIDPYALMLPRGDAAFKALVDRALVEYFRSGAIMATYDKWFAKPIPPRGVTLNFPLSAPLRKAFATPTDSPDPASYE